MSEPAALEVRLARRVHDGLRLDISLSLGAECGVVFGPSGAGKTSLLRLIAGLDRPDSGAVRLGDAVLDDTSQHRRTALRHRRIGMVFQDDLLFPHLTVADNICFGLHRRPREEAGTRLADVAALCGVKHLLDRWPPSLSGGERQRVGLARALAPKPRLLLCDEPVSALDWEARLNLIERLRAIQRAECIPLLYVTHSPAEAVALGTRLFLLREGRIVAEGSPLDVLAESAPSEALGELQNVFSATVATRSEGGATILRLDDGPELIVARTDLVPGRRVGVSVRAEEILLAVGPIGRVSAHNVMPGTVERLILHGRSVEVLVRTGGVVWVVSIIGTAVSALELQPGGEVLMIVKARSCRVLDST